MITPEQAREIEIVNARGIGMSQDAGIICDLADQIANMKWEYAAQLRDGEWQNYIGYGRIPNGDYQMRLLPPNCARGWTEDRPEAYELWDDLELYERRIVRRLVSEPEEYEC